MNEELCFGWEYLLHPVCWLLEKGNMWPDTTLIHPKGNIPS